MPSPRLFTSNRLEILADALAEVLKKPLSSPFARDIIVVQSKGMERWVSMEIATRHGICANISYPFPNNFVYEMFRRIIPDVPERSPFDPRIMTWKIMKLLPSCIQSVGFESLRGYIREGDESLKLFQLSERIADTFDQYLLFRPEMILRWEGGEETHWQPVLWRELVQENGNRHRAALGKALFAALEKPLAETGDLPERVSVFGISALPPFHTHVLAALSRFMEVNLFLMSPCREYWGHILSDRHVERKLASEGGVKISSDDLHLEKGNSLLASLGTLGRDFSDLVIGFGWEEVRSFEDPGKGNLLSSIQSDILNLRDRAGGQREKQSIEQSDASVQIQSCHSPMREIEILQDWLLRLFDQDPTLMPRDILVMTPDIETYAPYIQAVFDLPPDDPKRIPFSIADRSIRREGEIVDTYLAILDLLGGRFGASEVLAILESDAVMRKYGLSASDLDLMRKWVGETRIRWGIDAKSRSDLGLPEFCQNTWVAGLERLLLGYALPGQEEHLFAGILPYDPIEGSETSLLGSFLHFAEALFAFVSSLRHKRPLGEWSKRLTELLDHFFVADEKTEKEMQVLRTVLAELEAMQGVFDEEIGMDVIRWHVGQHLKREGFGFGFVTGRTTFCAMLPMRSIPFRVICLVGMNGDAYPRQSRPLGFDLMAQSPRPGDRSLRNEDRYLFLEAILSARERLYISYVGQSIQDDSVKPPSVVVSEFLDYGEQGFEVFGKTTADWVVTKHHLQAFCPEYFRTDNKKLFSYSEANCQAAQSMRKMPETVPFISRGLTEPGDDWETVDLTDFCRFFANPTKYLLNRRLGVFLDERSSILEEKESFEIRGLERYLFEQDLLEKRFAGHDLGDFLTLVRASGRLPHGTVGECSYEGLRREVDIFVKTTRGYLHEPVLEPLNADLRLARFRMVGQIKDIHADRLIQCRYALVKPRDRLITWIHHLVLNLCGAAGYPVTSMLVGLDRRRNKNRTWAGWEYGPVEKAEEILATLLETYWQGLVRPLHFFPESSWEYATMLLRRGKSTEEALQRARRKWEKSDYERGESEDPHFQLCFRNTDPLDATFCEIAVNVFQPLLEHGADRTDDDI
jgi:exodeoxyribonuclease V gamma subunit